MNFLSPIIVGVLLIAIILLVYWVSTFITFYHLIRFGIGTQPKEIAFIFLLGSVALFFLSATLFAGIDFQVVGGELGALMGNAVTTTYLQ